MPEVLIFRHESASADLLLNEKTGIHMLMSFYSEMPGLGHGKGLMEKILAYCDENDVTIRLKAQPYGHCHMSTGTLVSFYKSFGFKEDPYYNAPNKLIRRPNRGKTDETPPTVSRLPYSY